MRKRVSLLLALALLLALGTTVQGEENSEAVFRFEKPVTLRVSVFDRGMTGQTPVDNNYWTAWIQKAFGDPRNIKIEWVVIPRSEEVPKLNILMASGEAADICFTYTEAVITNFVKQGGLIELTDLIEQYGQNAKAYLGENLLSYGIFEGGQYAIPAKRVVLSTNGTFIREDWLEKLGMAMPTTKEEFYNCLAAFRDKNPGGVEKVIPLAMHNDPGIHNHLRLSFIKDLTEKILATVPDLLWDGYEDYVIYLNKLYNEGLIMPDFALDITNQSMTFGAVSSGQAGAYSMNYDHPIRVSPGILSALHAFEPEAKLSPVNCFESVTDPTKYYHDMYAPNGLLSFIPVFSKQPEAAMMYLNWLTDLDVLYFLQNGEEGLHHKLADGVPVLQPLENEYRFNSMQNLDYTLLTNGQEFLDPELRIKAQALSYQGYADLYEPMYRIYTTDPVTTTFHFDVILPADAQYGTSLLEFKREVLTKSVMAKPEDCLQVFRALRDQYMQNGGQAVMEEKIAAWDNMHKGS